MPAADLPTGRQLSPLEKILWRMSEAGSMNFTMVTRLQGSLQEAALRSALDTVQRKHGLLRVRIEQTPRGPAFQTQGVPCIPLHVVDATANTREELQAEVTDWIAKEVNVTVPWTEGPLVRCVWIRHNSNVQHLLVTFHHAISDGMSGVIFTQDLLVALDAPSANSAGYASAEPRPLPAPMDDRFPQQVRGLRSIPCIFKAARWLHRQDKRCGPPSSVSKDAEAIPASHEAFIFIREFDQPFTSLLIELARSNNSTVHAVLSTAMALVLAEDIGAGSEVSIKHRSAVNLRDQLRPPVNGEIGFFVSILFNRAKLSGTADFWEVARNFRDQLRESKELNVHFGLSSLLPVLYKIMGGDKLTSEQLGEKWKQSGPGTCGLTNLGRVDLPTQAGNLKVEAFYFAIALSELVDFSATAATYAGKLTWNFMCPKRVFGRVRAEQLVAKIVARLEAAVAE